MSTESPSSALQRFARDLRRIREQREISISALNEATRVPESHIQAFEEGTLYEQSRMNVVYLKAFVRAYAETLGIPSDAVVNQLEAALAEEYKNRLAARFLDEPPSETDDQQSLETESSPSSDPGAQAVPPGDSADKTASAGPGAGTEADASTDAESEQLEEASSEVEHESSERTEEDAPSPPTLSPPRTSSSSGKGASSQSATFGFNARRLWTKYAGAVMSVVLILLVLAFGGGLASLYFGGEGGGASSDPAASADLKARSAPPDTSVSSDTVGMDTSNVETETATASQSQRPPANVTLGDTLHAVVEATDVVAGIRVQQDDDLRRPYWIEPGEAQVFPFTRRITFENQLDSLRLFLENYPYPTTRTNEEGQIIISRDTARQFADTLRGNPASFPSPSDTVQIGPGPDSDADTLAQGP